MAKSQRHNRTAKGVKAGAKKATKAGARKALPPARSPVPRAPATRAARIPRKGKVETDVATVDWDVKEQDHTGHGFGVYSPPADAGANSRWSAGHRRTAVSNVPGVERKAFIDLRGAIALLREIALEEETMGDVKATGTVNGIPVAASARATYNNVARIVGDALNEICRASPPAVQKACARVEDRKSLMPKEIEIVREVARTVADQIGSQASPNSLGCYEVPPHHP